MAVGTVLVTGVHREELEFGDRVAERIEGGGIEVLRIPKGVPQRCMDVDQQFQYETRQRELYLQLHQQVKGRYALLIDLHSGFDENGPGADLYCHESALLDCVGSSLDRGGPGDDVRLIRIVAPDEKADAGARHGRVQAGARTGIPPVVWGGGTPLYVGLEIYLPDDRGGIRAAEVLAQRLIDRIRRCGAAA